MEKEEDRKIAEVTLSGSIKHYLGVFFFFECCPFDQVLNSCGQHSPVDTLVVFHPIVCPSLGVSPSRTRMVTLHH